MMKLIFHLSMILFVVPSGTASGQVQNPHGEIAVACDECHTTDSWKEVSFDHEETGFPLRDSHTVLGCTRCHDLENFSAPGKECSACHEDVHEAKLGPLCERCHTTEGWEVFDVEEIHRRTRLPLFGKHNLIDCLSCHPNLMEGDYTRGVADCVECHESDYLSAEDPRHVSLGFSTFCMECHELVAWRPALFATHDARFPIYSGEHRGVWNSCSTCHIEPGDYTVFSCLVCHHRAGTDSEHQGIAGYYYDSEACFLCHPTGSGEGLVSNHDADYFPISSGPHASAWQSCTDCHTDPGNWSVFSCIDCHEHEQADADQQHSGITGYAYESSLCFACHPTGEAGEFREHDSLYFPIFTGSHQGEWQSCADCHTDPENLSVVSCIDCHEHEQAVTDQQHTGIPDYAYESSRCLACHPTGEGGEFREHDSLYFPIYSGSHSGAWDGCVDCHFDPQNWVLFTCTDCHAHDRSRMDQEHDEVSGYVYESSACFECHPDGREALIWKKIRPSKR